MPSVLIADDDVDFANILCRKLKENSYFDVVAKLHDGESAIRQIESLRPDIIILDIIMPGSDGIYIVNHIKHNIKDYSPIIYMLSGIGSNKIISSLSRLDIDFFSMKPVPVNVILQNLETIMEKKSSDINPVLQRRTYLALSSDASPYARIVEELSKQLGILPHRKSTRCLNDALVYCMENPNGTQLITKVLYPEIARKYGLTSSAVERNIRHAILSIKKAKTPVFDQIFSYADNKRISNGEFLAVVTEYLTMQATHAES